MPNSNITDMTHGNPTRHLLLFSLPTLIGNIFQQIYNLADSVIVGRFVGANAFAAVVQLLPLHLYFSLYAMESVAVAESWYLNSMEPMRKIM